MDPNATMPNFHLTEEEIEELSHYLFSGTVPRTCATAIEAAAASRPATPRTARSCSRSPAASPATRSKGRGTAPRPSSRRSPPRRRAAGCSPSCATRRRSIRARGCRTTTSREAESRDVVAYIEDELRDFDAPKDILEPLRVNQTLAETGGEALPDRGCFACHGAERARRRSSAPS